MNDPVLNPTLRSSGELPRNVLFSVASIDILVVEQLEMMKRLNNELQSSSENPSRIFKSTIYENQFHGWLECKLILMNE